MICPACKSPLREKSASGLTLDVCYGGCGGIWFDATELERVSASAATSLHSIWQMPLRNWTPPEPRMCPRCPDVVLEPMWFSDLRRVEIDRCPKCDGIWLDAGEFTRVYEELKGAKVTPPGWAWAIAEAAVYVRSTSNP